LVISSAITDGTGFFASGVTKSGLGDMQYDGSSANTYTGTTTVNDGTLNLNKTGVGAMAGALVIGDGQLSGNGSTGLSQSDVVRLKQSDQLPDFQGGVTVNSTGLLDLTDNSEAAGTGD